MAPGPVLLPLTTWTEEHISAIYNATTTADLDASLDAFLTKHAHITVNGKHLSREGYKALLAAEKANELNARVTFGGAIFVPSNSEKPADAGTVGLIFTAAITTHIIKTSTISASLNVTVIQDQHLNAPNEPVVFDKRRVSALNQILVDRPDDTGVQPGIVTNAAYSQGHYGAM